MNKFHVTLTAKAELIKPDSDKFKTVASSIKKNYGFELKPQIDLLYVRSCLVTTGMNDNDDIFLPDEMWKARFTPVLKPSNWQHKDKDIVGVVYSTEARDLNGNILDLNKDKMPDGPFEYWTESVVFKLIHDDKAEEIEKRAAAGTLFVSMEAWFDDYNYGFMSNDSIEKVIARNSETSFLDTHLRVNGGSGKYNNAKFGRALKNITFGGFGFVDQPANKRSVIDSVLDLSKHELTSSVVHEEAESDINTLLKSLFSNDAQEKEDMEKVTASNSDGVDVTQIANNVAAQLKAERLARRDARRAKKHEKKLKVKAEKAQETAEEAATKAENLSKTAAAATAKADKLSALAVKMDSAVAALVKELAGATDDTPPEIKAIDAAIAEDSGDAVFQAKIAWIQKSMGELVERANHADALEGELSKAGSALREQEIRATFADAPMSKEEVDHLVKAGLAKTDEAYAEWLLEKQLFLKHMKGDAAKKPAKKNQKNQMKNASPPDEEDDDDEDDAAKAARGIREGFAALINGVPEGEESDLSSGVNAGGLRKPKDKIAGSKVAEDVLDGVEPENRPNLSDADGSEADEGEGENAFRTLANELLNNDSKKDRPAKAKAGFDPVDES